MPFSKNVKNNVMNPDSQIHWLKLAVAVGSLVILSFALAYLLQRLISRFNLPMYDLAYLAYSVVFATTMISNLTIIAPVPFAVSIMIALATKWNPVLIALAASIGGTIGELSGYYAGYLGRKIAISDNIMGHNQVERWIQRYGFWAIFFLALQPFIPFDIGGLVAGAARMPLQKFIPALWAAKFPKYLILIYTGLGFIHFLPFLSP